MLILLTFRSGIQVARIQAPMAKSDAQAMGTTGTAVSRRTSTALHKYCADISGDTPNHRRTDAIIEPFPQKYPVQASRAHTHGPLYADLHDPGMDIGINCIDNVQDSYEADEQNQDPGQQTDLGLAFRILAVRLFIGHRDRPRYSPAEFLQHPVKSCPVGTCS